MNGWIALLERCRWRVNAKSQKVQRILSSMLNKYCKFQSLENAQHPHNGTPQRGWRVEEYKVGSMEKKKTLRQEWEREGGNLWFRVKVTDPMPTNTQWVVVLYGPSRCLLCVCRGQWSPKVAVIYIPTWIWEYDGLCCNNKILVGIPGWTCPVFYKSSWWTSEGRRRRTERNELLWCIK